MADDKMKTCPALAAQCVTAERNPNSKIVEVSWRSKAELTGRRPNQGTSCGAPVPDNCGNGSI